MDALFSQCTLDFLAENRNRNSKDWFNEHKDIYRRCVVAPLTALAETLSPILADIDIKLVGSSRSGFVSRVWRDARFSKDKSLFRETMWCMFVREKNKGLPEFFFVISPEGFLYGCGYYSAGAASMESIRNLILTNDMDFLSAFEAYKEQSIFVIDGEKFKRSRYPDAADDVKEWLDRKTICFIKSSADFELLYSDGLADAVAEGFRTLAPIYKFLIKAEGALARTA